ncbi:MAG: hypothetical protein HRU14_04695 [Planctomycetes bacterium]|nr:hypothetical protein [Planctomycetota bacterium]
MRSVTACLLVAVLAMSLAPVANAQIAYTDFSSTAGMILNGSAAQNGNVLRITPNLGGQAGTAWYQSQVPVSVGFSTTFVFQMAPASGADGMTFIIHNDPNGTAALAGTGGSMGWTSEPLNPALTMQNLLVVELDPYNNGNFGDPNDNHISVHLVPTIPTTVNGADEYYSIAQAIPPFDLNDGAAHTMCINYNPGTLDIFLDGSATPLISVPFDFATGATTVGGVALPGLTLTGGLAYAGFSGGTGGLAMDQDILAWTFGPPGACGSLVGPWQVNSPRSSLDLNGTVGTAYSPAITTDCVGATVTLNAGAPAAAPFDIAVTFATSIPAALTTAAGQQVNVDIFSPTLFNFNGGTPNFAGILNLLPHPGAFTFPVPTGAPLLAAAQQLAVDAGHPDGFQLSQAVQANILAAGGTQTLTLGDDSSVQIILGGSPYCANTGVVFYGTVYNDFHVGSNGDVTFTAGSNDFTATALEWQTQMPRIGIAGDLEPNNYGTVTVTSNGNAGLGDWMTVAYAGVTEWGTGGLGVTSFNVDFHGPNGHEINGFTTDGTWGATPVVGGMSLGSGGTHPALVSFDGLNGLGLQANVSNTDSVIDASTFGMLANTSGWTSIGFPLFDGSAYIVQ